MVETNQIGSVLSPKLEKAIPQVTRFKRCGVNPWNDTVFVDALNSTNRSRILIAGLSAETSLSFMALCALEWGFDVYVVRDVCLGYSEKSIAVTFDRLLQAGAVSVTWRQVIMEWKQDHVDGRLLRRIFKPDKLP